MEPFLKQNEDFSFPNSFPNAAIDTVFVIRYGLSYNTRGYYPTEVMIELYCGNEIPVQCASATLQCMEL